MTKNLPATKENDNIADILGRVKKQIDPKDHKALAAYFGKNVVQLGVHEAFALRDNEGEIRAFKQSIHLTAKDGTLIQPVPGGPFVISAQGYEVWAEAAGANVIFPKTVLVGVDDKPNPYAERDGENRRILAVHARAVAFRFSSKGIPQVSDWSTIFDTPSYRLIDLLAKAKKFPQAFLLLPKSMNPKDDENEDGTWAEYPFDESTRLWVNTQHPEALGWFSQIINREKKALDFAQTFARRNALKHLSGLQKAPGPEWTIPVLSWRPTSGNIVKWDATQYIQLQDKVGSLIQANGEDFAPGQHLQIEKEAGKERIDEPDLEAEEEAEDHETATEPPIDVEHKEVKAEKKSPLTKGLEDLDKYSEEQKTIMANYDQTAENFPEEVSQAFKDLAIEEGQKIGPTLAEAIMQKVDEYLDYQAEG